MPCVSVGAGPPVAVGLALRSYCFMNAVTTPCVDEPLVEYAIVLPSVSLSDLMGEVAGTYQYRSDAPVVSAPMMRTGAPFENAESTPMIPGATPMSTLFEMTACCVSPPPCVHRISSVSPCFLKMPARCPSSAIVVSQLPRWPAATLSVSSACAGSVAAKATAARATPRCLNVLIGSSSQRFRNSSVLGPRAIVPAISGRGRDLRLVRLVRRAQRRPFGVLRHDALESSEPRLRREAGRGPDRGAAVAHLARGVDRAAPALH